jgi:NAD(P)-dependent dehydrogenase (short-subunit alcohol dehydrogenase family)
LPPLINRRNKMQLKDKVAIITGSARGMGREFAIRFAKEGAKVVVCDVLDCEPTAKDVKTAGGEVLAIKTDVTSETDTVEMAKKAVERFGRIDILVNNAALFGGIEIKNFIKPFDQISVQEWDRLMAVNLKGIFLCCKAVVPYMKKQGQGKIVNIASTVAFQGASAFLHYTTSKGGVVSMTRGMARGLGEFNINVNAIAPGLTMTESALSMGGPNTSRDIQSGQIIKRPTEPKHIAGPLVFLCSADADQITGEILAVNAGEYLC